MLAFYWVDGTLGSPVNRVREIEILSWRYKDVLSIYLLWTSVSVEFHLLLLGHCGEKVVSNSKGVFMVGIDFVDYGIDILEEFKSEVVFFDCSE